MFVGMLTAPFAQEPLEDVLSFAEDLGIGGLEVVAGPGSKHIDPATLKKPEAKRLREELEARELTITALGYYDVTITNPDRVKAVQDHAKRTIDAAEMLGVSTVGMLPGFPAEGMSKIETIRNVLPEAFGPILAHAKKKGVRIALENWFQTCLQGLDTFECLFEAIPDENFGLNYDPSHLVHQECDYMAPVRLYADRLFHTHAKDTLIDRSIRAQVGVYGAGWWRYVIPGFGEIKWGAYVGYLRAAGYDGVLSIEHEDGSQTREDGFIRGAYWLDQFC